MHGEGRRDSQMVCQVPYSLHCNYKELRSFISALRPRQIVPTVPRGVKGDISVGLEQLCADLAHDSALIEDFQRSEAALLQCERAHSKLLQITCLRLAQCFHIPV